MTNLPHDNSAESGQSVPQPPRTNLSDDPMPVDGHAKADGRYRWYLVENRQADQLMPQIRPNDWLLVFTEPDQSDLSPTDDQPIVVVCQSTSGGTIHLRPHPSEQISHRYRIYLRELTTKIGPFVRNQGTGEIFFPPAGQEFADLTKIIGIVVGLWRPTSQVISTK
jgi:hypothetical protein